MRIVEVVHECPESGTHSPSFEPEAGLCSEAPKRLCRETLRYLEPGALPQVCMVHPDHPREESTYCLNLFMPYKMF